MRFPCGKEVRELKFTYGAMRALEREAGVSIFRLFAEDRVGLDTLCLLVWAGLRHTDPKLTTAQVEAWLEEYLEAGDFNALMVLVMAALQKVKWLKMGNPQTEAANPTSAQ